jgi:prepilin-type N-terminal cleavage/methylation domain-containing protein
MRLMNSKSQDGYSLVEVLIAIALTGTVLVGIMTLFYQGRRNVYSGKQMTQAVAVATRVREDLNTLNKSATAVAFGLPAGAGAANTVGGQSFPNSIIRTTTNITAGTDPRGFMNRWITDMGTAGKFQDPKITLVFTPDEDPTNNPAQVGTCSILRLRIFVEWSEALRDRMVTLDAVKIERP